MLRTKVGNFSAVRIMEQAGIDSSEVLVRTVTRLLNEKGYYYFQAQKNGLLKTDDLKTRLSFAKWCKKISLKIFGLSIYHSFWTELGLPPNQIPVTKATKGRTWRKISEGLTLHIRGKKRGNWQQSVKTHGGHEKLQYHVSDSRQRR